MSLKTRVCGLNEGEAKSEPLGMAVLTRIEEKHPRGNADRGYFFMDANGVRMAPDSMGFQALGDV